MPATDITTIEGLRRQLYAALQLEHATIPVYLTALYSVRQNLRTTPDSPVTNVDVQQILRVVALEEMLHLTLVANLMNAVKGEVDLTRHGFLPSFPQPLPDGERDFEVGLGPFSEETLATFLKIERPSMAPDPSRKAVATRAERISALTPQPPSDPNLRYYSIGDFYAAISEGLVRLEEEARATKCTIFKGDPTWQASSRNFYSAGGRLEPVTDLNSALRAISLIIEQGEGETNDPFGTNGELAHYYRFQQIRLGRYYRPHDKPCHPTGPTFKVDFGSVYPIKPNIRMADYPPGSELADAARRFNQRYAAFLKLLTDAFSGKPELLEDAVPKMCALRDDFDVLARNPLPGTPYNAGPTFELYETAAEPPLRAEAGMAREDA